MSFGPGPNLAGSLFLSASNSASPIPDSQDAAGTDPGCGDGNGGDNPPGDTPPTCNASDGGDDSSGGMGWSAMPDSFGGGAGSGVFSKESSGNLWWPQFSPPGGYTWDGVAFPQSVGDTSCLPPPGLPPGCVVAATRIALFPEGCAAAGELAVGDLLLTRTATGEAAGEAITALLVSRQPCLCVETEDGRELHCSLSHEVMVAEETRMQGR